MLAAHKVRRIKMKKCYLLILCGLLISGSTFAYCPDGQNAEKIVECIIIEGAGENYQDWSKKCTVNLKRTIVW